MRKCAAILCAAVMTVSACACGRDRAPSPKANVSSKVTTTTATLPSMNYTEDLTKDPLNLVYATSFSDGVALVRYVDKEGVTHSAAINTAGDVLFEMPAEMPFDQGGYKNGILVAGNVIYDKTGKVIASPELSGYDTLMTGSCGGYVLAKKAVNTVSPAPDNATVATDPSAAATEPSATATGSTTDLTTGTTELPPVTPTPTVVSVGVLNNKGEWVHPLSADHPIALAMAATTQPIESITYVTDGVVRVYVAGVAQYYHFADNKLTPNYVHYASFEQQGEEAAGIYKMAVDGSKKLVVENVIGDYFFADAFVGRAVTPSTEPAIETVIGPTKLYDYEGNELMDLSAYPLSGPLAFYENGYLTLPTTDSLGSRLLVVLNAQGQLVFEPLALGMRDVYYAPDVSGFVVESYTADGRVSYRHFDYTGTITAYTDVTSFLGFHEGLAVVTLLGDTERYYFVNHHAEIVLG